jgi:hypothetical protein
MLRLSPRVVENECYSTPRRDLNLCRHIFESVETIMTSRGFASFEATGAVISCACAGPTDIIPNAARTNGIKKVNGEGRPGSPDSFRWVNFPSYKLFSSDIVGFFSPHYFRRTLNRRIQVRVDRNRARRTDIEKTLKCAPHAKMRLEIHHNGSAASDVCRRSKPEPCCNCPLRSHQRQGQRSLVFGQTGYIVRRRLTQSQIAEKTSDYRRQRFGLKSIKVRN